VLHKSLEFNNESQRTKFAKRAQFDNSRGGFRQQNKNKGARNVRRLSDSQGLNGALPQEPQPQRTAPATSECRQSMVEQQATHGLRHPSMPEVQAFWVMLRRFSRTSSKRWHPWGVKRRHQCNSLRHQVGLQRRIHGATILHHQYRWV